MVKWLVISNFSNTSNIILDFSDNSDNIILSTNKKKVISNSSSASSKNSKHKRTNKKWNENISNNGQHGSNLQ